MALTNYLAQSIVCGLVFYGFGLGWYGRVTGYPLYGVVGAVWCLEIAWSLWWLRRFQIGPFEWAWRSLTYRRWQAAPIHRKELKPMSNYQHRPAPRSSPWLTAAVAPASAHEGEEHAATKAAAPPAPTPAPWAVLKTTRKPLPA
jgi:hypothetical protein